MGSHCSTHVCWVVFYYLFFFCHSSLTPHYGWHSSQTFFFPLQAERRALSENVPEEPARDSHDKMCTLRLRYPDGEVGQRRFLALHTLGVSFLRICIHNLRRVHFVAD